MRHQPPILNRQRAKKKRVEATRPEAKLWGALCNRQLEGFKFRRQVPLKGYILDFVCFDAKLIVEVDGWQHADNGNDVRRDAAFVAAGFRILRVWNGEVLTNIDGVCLTILSELRNTGEG